ncbi:energy-coupling factor ABC transporter ATP-binding protein [Actinobacillus equuli]|uniref:energy-coupling factor ABC transporter ATP-binding protein n=1 Tax=Actinobacillus equuli TaxID=718 RepID=UPI0024413129|nr:energy-coupling factor ABC transporter ATP-binding protein [Actinobacillus equuli]WGE41951.1 energy-coupling factor ABC transporter ATP-binding protein [Actinobacillus equuli subsp. haemolyticus]WGE58914.1 energy-coupling factor ABC transporter ATP-binding protein [Actinobacillus equuli subsp. haemolyticus]WGE60488.1 energy-coupling factor ABC transporter ATP-binding protein [Actinobacillus equuli subsp. haemolyticus]
MSILEVNNLTVLRNQQAVINALSFAIEPQQRVFLQGEIGVGKSTLLLSLLGFLPIHAGDIYLFGTHCQREKDFVPFRGKVGICFQNAEDQLFGPTVLDDVAFGVLNQGYTQAQAYQIALEQLQMLDLEYLKDRPVNALSGGEQNFTALAGVLAMKPKLLLLDEPTNGLDAKNCAKLTALLKQLQLPMLVASHDQTFTQQLADKTLYLQK